MKFDSRHHDFGEVKKGEVVQTSFRFTNTGEEDIEIEIISACECTTLDWPRKPIKSGATGTIHVSFDSAKKEESETIDIDINLKNRDPETGYPRFEIITYTYTLIP